MDLALPFLDAVALGDEVAAVHLLSLGVSVKTCDHLGATALHVAASSERAELLVPLLLQRGADVEAKVNMNIYIYRCRKN